MNSWQFTGNLGKDAETRFTPGGDAIVQFSVGVKSGYGDKATTTWARCAMWGKRGEAVAQYLTKGQLVGISGELTLREFANKEGAKQSSLEVRVNDLTLLGKRDDAGKHQAAPQQHNPQSFDDMDSDLPF